MGYNDEIRMIKMKLNAMIEENEKLKGSFKLLQSMNESLQIDCKKKADEAKKYKKAFDDIFVNNIGNKWEEFSDDERNKMSLDQKITFFNTQVNYSKLYIRDYMERKMDVIKNERDKLKEDNRKLKEDNERMQEKLKTSEILKGDTPKAGRPFTASSNPNDDIFSDVKQADENIKTRENNLKDTFNSLMGKENNISSVSNIHQETPSKPPVPPKPSVPRTKTSTSHNVSKPSMNPPPSKEMLEKKKELDYLSKWRTLTASQKEDIQAKVVKATKSINFTTKHLRFLEIMGNTGLYQMKDILAQDNTLLSTGYEIKKKLVEIGIVSELEEVKADSRSFKPIMLSDIGNWLYLFQYKKNPCESIFKRLIIEQKSPQHGVRIKSIVEILSGAGYDCTQEDTQTTPSGRETICDVLATKRGNSFRIEYEEGNYSQEDYIDKFLRVWEVTPYLIVIVPNEQVKVKIIHYVLETVARRFKGIKAMKDNGYQYLVETINSLKTNPSVISNLVRQRRTN